MGVLVDVIYHCIIHTWMTYVTIVTGVLKYLCTGLVNGALLFCCFDLHYNRLVTMPV